MSLSQRVGHRLVDINASRLAAFCFAAFSSNALDDELCNVKAGSLPTKTPSLW